MKKNVTWALALVMVLVLMVLALLSGCSGGAERVVNVCGWGENIDPSLIDEFKEKTGITVNYQTAESNETMYALIKQGGADYDVIVPSDYMIAQMIEEGLLAKLDYSNIPNYSLIGEQYKNLSYDPNNEYSVPYTWGTLGIIYNSAKTSERINSWDALFETWYAGEVAMIGNPRDALAIALMDLGYSVNTTDEGQIQEAYQLIAGAKDAGVYQGFFMDELYDKMEAGETTVCAYYAGDFLSMYSNNSDLRFEIPEEGSNWFVDAMCVLKDAEHKEEAEEWINFICETDSCLKNMDYIWYASPNTEALEQYPDYYKEAYGEELDPELYAVMAPPDAVLDYCEPYSMLPENLRTLYNDLWTQLRIE